MDELLRPSPDERRKKRIAVLKGTSITVAALTVVALVGFGINYAVRAWKNSKIPVSPAAYLIATEGPTTLRIAKSEITLTTTRAVPGNIEITLTTGKNVALLTLYPASKLYPKIGDVAMSTSSAPASSGSTTTLIGPATPDPDAIDFLNSPREILVSAHYQGPSESTGRVLVTSPFGVTRFTNPVVAWEPRLGMRYDIAVVDPADPAAPPRIARNMLPPVRIDQLETTMDRDLEPDRIYNVIVRETGSETQIGGMRFLVSPEATNATLPLAPAALVIEAITALIEKPTRTGDAWLALSRLPPEWADSELALRLRMRAAAELGLFDEIEKIQNLLARLGPSSAR